MEVHTQTGQKNTSLHNHAVKALVVAQVTHVHAVGSDADHCQLCIVMHSVVPFVVFVVGVILVRIGTTALTPREVRTICRNWHPTLFNRPPPAGC